MGILLTIGFLYWQYAKADNELTSRAHLAQTYSSETVIYKPTFTPQSLDQIEQPKQVRQRTYLAQNRATASSAAARCSCVLFVKSQTGFNQSVGNARNWPVNLSVPKIGAVVITNESRAGHVAVITDIQDNYLILSEANYTRCQITHSRKLSTTSPLIIGFYETTL